MGNLLYWAVVFLIIALIAAFLGFGGVAGVATEGARLLFWVAIILVVLSFIGGMLRRGWLSLSAATGARPKPSQINDVFSIRWTKRSLLNAANFCYCGTYLVASAF